MDYNAPSGSQDTNADYVGATASTVGSKIPPNVPMLTQRELVNLELVAGLTPSNGDRTQIAQAVGRGPWVGILGANPNALVGTLGGGAVPTKPGILQVLQPWTRLRGIALQTNTAVGVTVTVVGIGSAGGYVTGPLLKKGGAALKIGDVPALVPFEFQPDGNGNFWMVGSVASDGTSPATQVLVLHGNAQIMRDQYFDLVTGWTTQDKNTFTTSTYANGIFTCGAGEGGLYEIEANFSVLAGYQGHGYDMLFCVNGAQTGGPTTYPTNIRANRESSSQYDGFEAFGDSAQVFLSPGDQFGLWLYYTTLAKAGYAGTPWGRFTSDAATNLKIRRVLAA